MQRFVIDETGKFYKSNQKFGSVSNRLVFNAKFNQDFIVRECEIKHL